MDFLKLAAARGCALCQMLFEQLICNLISVQATKSSLDVTREHGNISVIDINQALHRFELFHVDCMLLLHHALPNRLTSISKHVLIHHSV